MEIISRKQAQERGQRHYHTGKPCKNGNLAQRRTSNGDCQCDDCKAPRSAFKRGWHASNSEEISTRRKAAYAEDSAPILERVRKYRESNREACNERARKYRLTNLEGRKEYAKKYRQENGGKVRAGHAAWRDKNREKVAASTARYRAENPEVRRVESMRRNAAKLERHAAWDRELTRLVETEAAALAAIRQAETGISWHIDHMYPLRAEKVSGLHVWNNLQVIPAAMNVRKHNRLVLTQPGQWLQR